MPGSTPDGIAYPVATDPFQPHVDMQSMADDVQAVKLTPGVTQGVRAADLTVGPGVFDNLASVTFAAVAGASYLITSGGKFYIGGATADVTPRLRVDTTDIHTPGGIKSVPANTETHGPTMLGVFTATASGSVTAAYQMAVNAPATGLVLLAGARIVVARVA